LFLLRAIVAIVVFIALVIVLLKLIQLFGYPAASV